MSVTLMKTTCAALLAAVLGFGALAPVAEAGPREDRDRWEHRSDRHPSRERRDWGPPGHQKAHGKGHDKHHPGRHHEARSHDRHRAAPPPPPGRHWQPPRGERYGWQQPHPRDAFHRLSREERRQVQRRLARQGYYQGPIDGAWGPGTWNGMNAWVSTGNNGYSMDSTQATLMLLQALLR